MLHGKRSTRKSHIYVTLGGIKFRAVSLYEKGAPALQVDLSDPKRPVLWTDPTMYNCMARNAQAVEEYLAASARDPEPAPDPAPAPQAKRRPGGYFVCIHCGKWHDSLGGHTNRHLSDVHGLKLTRSEHDEHFDIYYVDEDGFEEITRRGTAQRLNPDQKKAA